MFLASEQKIETSMACEPLSTAFSKLVIVANLQSHKIQWERFSQALQCSFLMLSCPGFPNFSSMMHPGQGSLAVNQTGWQCLIAALKESSTGRRPAAAAATNSNNCFFACCLPERRCGLSSQVFSFFYSDGPTACSGGLYCVNG